MKTEIANARMKVAAERRRVLFPLGLADFGVIRNWQLFDADIGDHSAREIREYFIPDFSNWKNHDSYVRALDRLLKDLKAPLDQKQKPSPEQLLTKSPRRALARRVGRGWRATLRAPEH